MQASRPTAIRRAIVGLTLVGILGALLALPAAAAGQTDPTAPAVGGVPADEVLSSTLDSLAEATAVANGSGEPVAPADQVRATQVALSLPTEGAGSLMVRDEGRVVVKVDVAEIDDELLASLEAAGAVIGTVSTEYLAVTAEVSPADLAAVAAVPGVLAVGEVLTPMSGSNAQDQPVAADDPGAGDVTTSRVGTCATNPTGIRSEGDAQLGASTARSAQGVDGTGIKVGVLSDTYNKKGGAPADVANAELPGPTNPCGDTTAVQVLDPCTCTGIDEGRAMLQIVHDLAPKASLAFSSAFNSDLDFASEIHSLQANGANVIVDDITYFNEPIYQDGPIARAVDDVTAAGATYLSSAGNSTPETIPGGGSYEAPAFRPTPCLAAVAALGYTSCHDYDPTGATSNVNGEVFLPGDVASSTLGWNEPMFGVTTDLDYFLVDSQSNTIFAQSTANNVAGTRSPVEVLQWQNDTGGPRGVFFVVARKPTSTGTPRFKTIVHGNPAVFVQWKDSAGGDVMGPTIFGHNAALAAGTIAAVPFDDATSIEYFSSRGPATFCWQPVNGTSPAASMPCQTKNPDVAATDGTANSFFGGSAGGVFRFYGTSASAPHAAAVAALQTQKRACATPAERLAALRTSAVPFGSYTAADYGSGRVAALGAISALAPCGAGYHPMTTPVRILDSRGPKGGWSGPLPDGARELQITGLAGTNVPLTASAVVLNITVTEPTTGSYLKVWPSGRPEPDVSSLNYVAGETIPNLVTVKLGAAGRIQISNRFGSVHVLADVVGYFDNGVGSGDRFTGIDPVRLLDSRVDNGWSTSLPAGENRDIALRQPTRPGGVPATATAVLANVTVTEPTFEGYLRLWPTGEPPPDLSSLNFRAGQTIPNMVVLRLGTDGKVRISTLAGATHVVIDVVGYFQPASGASFYPVDAVRVLDSRYGKGLSGAWGQEQTRNLPIAGAPGTRVPSGAAGVLMNVTATEETIGGFVTVYPAGLDLPGISNLNFVSAQTIPNAVAVRLPGSGQISFYNKWGESHILADVVGYFGPPT